MRSIGWFATGMTVLVAVCLVVPLVVVMLSSFNPTNELTALPSGFSLVWYANIFRRAVFLRSFQFSLVLAACSTVAAVVMGLLCAVVLVRFRFPGREWLATVVMSPLIVPQVVLGMSLLLMLSSLGLVSSVAGLALAHAMLTLPYATRVLIAALTRVPVSLEDAGVIHGAPRPLAFLLVTVPSIKAGLVGAAIFAFVTSFDNFTASQFLVWDRTTLPVEVYAYIRTENDPTVSAISTLLVIGTVLVVVAVERWVGLETVTG